MVVSSRLTITNKIIYMNTEKTLCHSVSGLHHQLMYCIWCVHHCAALSANPDWASCCSLHGLAAIWCNQGSWGLWDTDGGCRCGARFACECFSKVLLADKKPRSPARCLSAHTIETESRQTQIKTKQAGCASWKKGLQIPVEICKEVWCVSE